MGAEGGSPGWKLSGLSGEEYVALIVAYNAELAKLPYVIGATLYTAGPYPGNPSQTPYGADELVDQIISQLPEEDNVFDRHTVYDEWEKSLGASGYNPETAIGKFRQEHPELGVPIGGERDYGRYRVQFFSGGIVYVVRDAWAPIGMARTEAELPRL
jgi:hypothetical protein